MLVLVVAGLVLCCVSLLGAADSPVVKLSTKVVESWPGRGEQPAVGMRTFYLGRFNDANELTLHHESHPLDLPGADAVTGPGSQSDLHLLLDSPRVYQVSYAANDQFPHGIRYLIGMTAAGEQRWAMPMCIDHGPADDPPNTRLEYLNVDGCTGDGIILTATRRQKRVLVIDPASGEVIEEHEVRTQLVDPIFSTFLAYNPQRRTLYATTGLFDDDQEQVRLMEWNLASGVEAELTQLRVQALTGIKSSIDSIQIAENDNMLLMTRSLGSRLGSSCSIAVFDLRRRAFVYEEEIYKWGRPAIVIGANGHFGVQHSDQQGNIVLTGYQITEPDSSD